jgi:hypothetical protein
MYVCMYVCTHTHTQDEHATFYYFRVASKLVRQGNYAVACQFINPDAANVH